MAHGYVYILSNPSMPGLVKIGRTDRTPQDRLRELNTTGVPTPFALEFAGIAQDSVRSEAEIHRTLSERGVRTSANREFFVLPVADAVDLVREVLTDLSPAVLTHESYRELARAFTRVRPGVMSRYIEEDEMLAHEARLKPIGDAGYAPAYQELSLLCRREFPAAGKWREYARAFLEAWRAEIKTLWAENIPERMRLNEKLGRAAAEYLQDGHALNWVVDVDFQFISNFLVAGDANCYEGFIGAVQARSFPAEIRERAAEL